MEEGKIKDTTVLREAYKTLLDKKVAIENESIQLDTKITVMDEDIAKSNKILMEKFNVATMEQAFTKLDEMYVDINSKIESCQGVFSTITQQLAALEVGNEA